ncbi:hypothetical protein WM46_05985 [Citrobacter freundii complex sp. CFNIH2]|nr:hypothetical protein WM46_05985 [Citrobacter freundii complex sp. CFNIH2]
MSTKKYILTSIHLCCFSTFALFASTITYADDVTPVSEEEKLATPESENESSVAEFDASLLRQEGQNQIDVSRFVYGSNVLPGKYRIDVLVNQNMVSNQEVVFKENE